jgi:phytoene/squalene synthetase
MPPVPSLAVSMTRAASQQTYYTIRFLVDRQRVSEAYRAYAYFRWVDDTLDASGNSQSERSAFLSRQQALLESSYQDEISGDTSPEEQMLVELAHGDAEENSGLQVYLRRMMAVMAFDADRRGRLIAQADLDQYTLDLATAVTEVMHYFVGHCCYAPRCEDRYLAVSAAHITHMLRDTYDDNRLGYYNIPSEVLEAAQITPQDVHSEAYRNWVRSRTELAKQYFTAGKGYLDQLESLRCRLTGYSYITRFDSVLDAIEQDGYQLRETYADHTAFATLWQPGRLFLASMFHKER